jgi:hypothetical protein
MPGSDLTDQTRTGPFFGSHLSDTVRRTAVGPVRRLSADRRTGLTVLNVFKNFYLSMSGPSDVNRERTGLRSVGAELTQGGGAKPNVSLKRCAMPGFIAPYLSARSLHKIREM